MTHVLLAPAKINATLEVLGRRPDGYHTLRSLMLPIGLYDRIEVDAADRPSFKSDDPSLGGDNLVAHALRAAGVDAPLAIRLAKQIPVGGGLGGGSSDAAAILRAVMDGTIAGRGCDWLAAARALGSDVPFFLAGTGALVEGTGERVTAIGSLPPWWVVVARPFAAVPTAHAYGLLDAAAPLPQRPRAGSVSLAAVDAVQRGEFAEFVACLHNDFHEIVLREYPAVARTAAALSAAGAGAVLLSGSGSCVFAAFADERGARAVAAAFDPAAAAALFVCPLHHDRTWR
jgi:4-diphosphocytidyl-2-C-methyl-D-erythritol kinase